MTPTDTPTTFWSLTTRSTEEAFSLYLEPIRSAFFRLSALDRAFAALVLVLIGIGISITPAGELQKGIPLMLGGFAGLALLREGLITRRGSAARICFAAAGFVLLMESFLYSFHQR